MRVVSPPSVCAFVCGAIAMSLWQNGENCARMRQQILECLLPMSRLDIALKSTVKDNYHEMLPFGVESPN